MKDRKKIKATKTILHLAIMKKIMLSLSLVLALLVLGFTQSGAISFVSANPDGSFPNLSMPIEYVNYTITTINGSLWAKIDGNYPISILEQSDCSFSGDLPMVYPMPPGTINIHVYLGDRELSWTNYTQNYPDALHQTAIGDWGMIFCMLTNVSDSFLLKIHYEHPLQTVNGSYLFLYDLNISPYLSEQSSNSTCYYTIRMETNATNIKTYTTATDTQWNPIQYTNTQEGTTQIISIAEHSEYNKPLPGDLVVEFSGANQVPELSFWILPALMAGLFLLIVVCKKKHFLKVEENSYLRDTS